MNDPQPTISAKNIKDESGDYIKHLMRKHHITIRWLAARMNISIARVRYVREYGVSGNAYVRDWAEAIERGLS